jgi:Tfp pilus assembly protein PilO
MYTARVQEYEELKALLPEQRELTMVLQSVQDRARGNGLVLKRFNPKEDVQQGQYSGKKIEVSVTSSFAALRNFFEQLAHYQRIVSITNFQLTQVDQQTASRTVDATFDLTAYYVSAEKLQKPANAAAPAGQPATGQAPAAVPPAK